MILQHFVDSCDRLRLMSADFERRNIVHVREPQISITLLLSLIYLLSFSGQNMALFIKGRGEGAFDPPSLPLFSEIIPI